MFMTVLFSLSMLNALYITATVFINNDANIFTVTMLFPPLISFFLLLVTTGYVVFKDSSEQGSKLTKYVWIINGIIFLTGFILMRNF